MNSPASLEITEIYTSIQGESSFAGLPCTFVRLSGCPLRCRWCDTAYAFGKGESESLANIIEKIRSNGVNLVELTGGEPLAQKATPMLIDQLIAQGFKVLIETGGSEPVAGLNPNLHIIMDIKCPGSNMSERNLWENLEALKPSDEIKFVLSGREDYEWARTMIKEYRMEGRFHVLLSCAFGLLAPKDLAQWMVEDRLQCRLNLQQHKYIWHPRAKGV